MMAPHRYIFLAFLVSVLLIDAYAIVVWLRSGSRYPESIAKIVAGGLIQWGAIGLLRLYIHWIEMRSESEQLNSDLDSLRWRYLFPIFIFASIALFGYQVLVRGLN